MFTKQHSPLKEILKNISDVILKSSKDSLNLEKVNKGRLQMVVVMMMMAMMKMKEKKA